MKRMLPFLLALALPVLCAGQNPRQAYIDRYWALAVYEMQRTGVPASITLAQALLESGAGQSPLATQAHNHFGLKCNSGWKGERFLYDDESPDECFRVYANAEESYRAHSDYLREQVRYRSLFNLDADDYKGWARGLRRAGYATDPAYASKLIKLIEEYKLDRFDSMAGASEPDQPGEPDSPEETEAEPEEPQLPVQEDEAVADPMRQEEPATETEAPGESVQEADGDTSVEVPAYRETVSLSMSRETFEQNGVPYIRTIEGETWESLAVTYGLFVKQLLKYNDLDAPTELKPGTRVYLARKKAQATGFGKYVVEREGETLWDISQQFGVQLKKLRLYNVWRGGAPLEPGDTVILRKL